jgi:hypothetical protein
MAKAAPKVKPEVSINWTKDRELSANQLREAISALI